MALIDVVKCQMNDTELCKKFESEDLRVGSQLVVYPSQIAFFVKGGQIFDVFETGTFTLKSNNIPLLNKVINLPFGERSPFQAEVWFINLTAKLDVKWETPAPIQLEDPKYSIIVPVRASGQYGMRVKDAEVFLKTLIGNASSFTTDKVDAYFKGKMIGQLNALISQEIALDKIPVLEINAHLPALSEYCNDKSNEVFDKYGLALVDFAISAINVPQNDPSIIKLKEAKDLAARLKITGKDIYQMERSFNVLDTAAANEGTGGQMVSMGAGMGVGFGVGSQMGNVAGQMMNTNPSPTPPPIPQQKTYFVYVNGQQVPGQTILMITNMVNQGTITRDTLIWCNGMANWTPAADIPELSGLFMTPPPIPPTV